MVYFPVPGKALIQIRGAAGWIWMVMMGKEVRTISIDGVSVLVHHGPGYGLCLEMLCMRIRPITAQPLLRQHVARTLTRSKRHIMCQAKQISVTTDQPRLLIS